MEEDREEREMGDDREKRLMMIERRERWRTVRWKMTEERDGGQREKRDGR